MFFDVLADSFVVVASLASVRYYDAPSQTHQPDLSTVLLLLMLLVSVLLLLLVSVLLLLLLLLLLQLLN